jgi:hypothetical protein
MPPSDTECDILSILFNILGDGSLSEDDADSRLPSADKEDIIDAFDSLRDKDFVNDDGDDGISLDPDEFNQWASYMYDCEGWSPRSLRERCPHQWEERFFGG